VCDFSNEQLTFILKLCYMFYNRNTLKKK